MQRASTCTNNWVLTSHCTSHVVPLACACNVSQHARTSVQISTFLGRWWLWSLPVFWDTTPCILIIIFFFLYGASVRCRVIVYPLPGFRDEFLRGDGVSPMPNPQLEPLGLSFSGTSLKIYQAKAALPAARLPRHSCVCWYRCSKVSEDPATSTGYTIPDGLSTHTYVHTWATYEYIHTHTCSKI
jgi:hypothetical protein